MILKNLLSMSGVNVVKSVLQFLMTLLMTYFVSPAEFGLVAFSLPFIAFIALLTDMGMSSAMIQRETLTADEAGAAVTLMVVIGIACALVLAALAGPLAGAVKMEGLSTVLAALSVSVVLSIAAMGPRAILERSLRYQTVAAVEAGAAIVATLVCVLGAIKGWGIWALISYYVLVQVVRASAFGIVTRHQVRLNFHWRRVVSILTFGGWILASNILNFAARNIGNLLIGSSLGPAAVGLYGIAYQVMIMPLMVISWPASGVLFATLSRMANREQQAKIVGAMMGATAIVTFPAMFYLTFGLKFPTSAALSEHWLAAVPVIAVLAPVGAVQSLAAYVGAILLANGEARLQFHTSAANSIAMIGTFIFALPLGLIGMVQAYLVVATIICIALVWLICHKLRLPYRLLAKGLLPGLLATALGLLAVWLLTRFEVSTLEQWVRATAAYLIAVLATYAVFFQIVRADLLTLVGERHARLPG
ncbi:hypothetical protein HY68_37385 [Streptomyces sp. AcH 505]|nr:hypothetical protein HY68_37385 [Streptomyces sp. AcH 505]